MKIEIQIDVLWTFPIPCPSDHLVRVLRVKGNTDSDEDTYLLQNKWPATISDSSVQEGFIEIIKDFSTLEHCGRVMVDRDRERK